MYKALFCNCKDKININTILDSRTFSPDFIDSNYDGIDTSTVLDYDMIVYYSPKLKNTHIESLRSKTAFHNIKLVFFTEVEAIEIQKEGKNFGADLVVKVPETDADLKNILEKVKSELDLAENYDKDVLAPFRSAVYEIFTTMTMLDVDIVQTYKATANFFYGEITGLMALGGKQKGMVAVTFPENFAYDIVSNITAVPADKLEHEDIYDGVGEIVNMIAGGAKARLHEDFESFDLTSPFVILGNEYKIYNQRELPSVVIVLKNNQNYFAVNICLLRLREA